MALKKWHHKLLLGFAHSANFQKRMCKIKKKIVPDCRWHNAAYVWQMHTLLRPFLCPPAWWCCRASILLHQSAQYQHVPTVSVNNHHELFLRLTEQFSSDVEKNQPVDNCNEKLSFLTQSIRQQNQHTHIYTYALQHTHTHTFIC